MPPEAGLSRQDCTDGAPAIRSQPFRRFARDDSRSSAPEAATPASILVVEDDFLVSMQVEAALLDAGFALAGVAVSAEEALQIAAATHPVVVLMDIRLAGKMDGVDAALALFRKQGIRCVFATAHHDPEVRLRAAPAQPLGWLPKPYTMQAMVIAVRQALQDLDQDA